MSNECNSQQPPDDSSQHIIITDVNPDRVEVTEIFPIKDKMNEKVKMPTLNLNWCFIILFLRCV